MMDVLISVVIPVYNMMHDGLLSKCIESLMNQTCPSDSFEIIAVDDCSTDDSFDYLSQRAADSHKVKIIPVQTKYNMKQGGARNLGLLHASGEYITFVDADDWVEPQYLELMLNKINDTEADVVGVQYNVVAKNGEVLDTLTRFRKS